MSAITAIKWIHASEAGMRSNSPAWCEGWNDFEQGWTECLVLNDNATPEDIPRLLARYETLKAHYPHLTLGPIPESITARIPALAAANH